METAVVSCVVTIIFTIEIQQAVCSSELRNNLEGILNAVIIFC